MIIIKILGGLGNQMFQYATAYSMSQKFKVPVKMDLRGLYNGEERSRNTYELDVFGIKEVQAKKEEIFPFIRRSYLGSEKLYNWYKKWKKIVHYKELYYHYNNELDEQASPNILLRGLFQSEKYFINSRKELLNLFNFPPLSGKNKALQEELESNNAVSIHIRRGDYVNDKEYSKNIGTCDISYYYKAIDLIQSKIENPIFYIFSDDISWVKENLKINNECVYVSWNKGKESYCDMQLMSLCKYNIIANSTFSWWGAWLNTYPEKIVIAPNKWFAGWQYDTKDLIPENWIQL